MKKLPLILFTVVLALCFSWLCYQMYQDSVKREAYVEFRKNMEKVYIDDFDSMYKVTFGDSTSFFIMEKVNDSLIINAFNIAIVHFNGTDDTLRFITFKTFPLKDYKDEFVYKIKYGDFFNGKIPENSNIIIKHIDI